MLNVHLSSPIVTNNSIHEKGKHYKTTGLFVVDQTNINNTFSHFHI